MTNRIVLPDEQAVHQCRLSVDVPVGTMEECAVCLRIWTLRPGDILGAHVPLWDPATKWERRRFRRLAAAGAVRGSG